MLDSTRQPTQYSEAIVTLDTCCATAGPATVLLRQATVYGTISTYQHSPMFGHLASSHTVCSFSSRSLDLISTYLSPPGTLLFSQSGFRVFSCAEHHGISHRQIRPQATNRHLVRQKSFGMADLTELTFQYGAATEYPPGRVLLEAERKSSRAGPAQSAVLLEAHRAACLEVSEGSKGIAAETRCQRQKSGVEKYSSRAGAIYLELAYF